MSSRLPVRLIGLVLASVALANDQAATETKPKVWTFDEMKWTKDKTLTAVETVALWGDSTRGEHGMLRKFPAGYAPPLHRHPSVERVVVISGTMLVQYSGGQTKALGPGSYSEIPAKMDHAVQCGKESDCVFLLSSSGAFAIESSGTDHLH